MAIREVVTSNSSPEPAPPPGRWLAIFLVSQPTMIPPNRWEVKMGFSFDYGMANENLPRGGHSANSADCVNTSSRRHVM